MISPTLPEIFFENHWEKQHLYVGREEANYYHLYLP